MADTISGKFLVARINGSIIRGVQDWEVDETADELDGTTGEDNGYENPDDGVWGATISMNLVQNLETGEYIRVRRGTLIEDLQLYRAATDPTPAFYFPMVKVFQSRNKGAIKERFTTFVRAKSKGEYQANNPG